MARAVNDQVQERIHPANNKETMERGSGHPSTIQSEGSPPGSPLSCPAGPPTSLPHSRTPGLPGLPFNPLHILPIERGERAIRRHQPMATPFAVQRSMPLRTSAFSLSQAWSHYDFASGSLFEWRWTAHAATIQPHERSLFSTLPLPSSFPAGTGQIYSLACTSARK